MLLTRDPILTALHLLIQRVIMFLVLCLLMSASVFVTVLCTVFDRTWRDVWTHLRAAWPPAADDLHALLLWGSVVVGVLLTTIVYLLGALWWDDRSTVHRRGTRLIDNRR